jgi:hypothetical protein
VKIVTDQDVDEAQMREFLRGNFIDPVYASEFQITIHLVTIITWTYQYGFQISIMK